MTAANPGLGHLEPVDLRAGWENEAHSFTPWLAEEDNLKLLGETIGIELELVATEKDVGPFRADILCRDTLTSQWVLIENQLTDTDHGHLGQLLTYAAGLKAETIVWIAARFTDEHRAALDWLNETAKGQVSFFGIEIELWRIGDSRPAPRFSVVSKPNDWSRSVAAGSEADRELTETQLLQRDYWSALRDLLIARRSIVKPQKPQPMNWAAFAIGRAYFLLWASMHTGKKVISVGVTFEGPHAKAHFHLLHAEKDAIEHDFGDALEWSPAPQFKSSWISLKADFDPTDRSRWPQQHEWMAERLERFHKAFAARIKRLDAMEYRDGHPGLDGMA